MAAPIFRKRHQKAIFAGSVQPDVKFSPIPVCQADFFICQDCCSRGHRRKGLCLRRVLWAILRHWGRFVVVPQWASFYLVLPLSLITRDMPATAFGAAVNVHRDARCEPALIGDNVGIVFGQIKILFLTVFTATGTHSTYLLPWNLTSSELQRRDLLFIASTYCLLNPEVPLLELFILETLFSGFIFLSFFQETELFPA